VKMLTWSTLSSPPWNVLPTLGDHRIALQGKGSVLACEVHGGACKRVAEAVATEP
jgi:hypothetical protein